MSRHLTLNADGIQSADRKPPGVATKARRDEIYTAKQSSGHAPLLID